MIYEIEHDHQDKGELSFLVSYCDQRNIIIQLKGVTEEFLLLRFIGEKDSLDDLMFHLGISSWTTVNISIKEEKVFDV